MSPFWKMLKIIFEMEHCTISISAKNDQESFILQKVLNGEKKNENFFPVIKAFYCAINVIIFVVWKLVFWMKMPVKVFYFTQGNKKNYFWTC